MRRQTHARLAAVLTSAVVLLTTTAGGTPPSVKEPAGRAAPAFPTPPTSVASGAWKSGHLQGMALDRRNGFMYWSFTDLLVKTDLRGKAIGSVTGFPGHLGDLAFNEQDGRVYGSLEVPTAKAYYAAIFDGGQINRMNIRAASSGAVSTVYLKEVVKDYTADMNGDGVFDGDTADTPDHRYGCSGIDGVAFGPDFVHHDGMRLTVAYGTYVDNARKDNDHQVLLQYDVQNWRHYERPMGEAAHPHRSGPNTPDGKYFAYTGNTTYGVQNLEYDPASHNWLMAVYKGTKKQFPNYSLFVVDGSRPPVTSLLRGQPRPERGLLLPLLRRGLYDKATGIYGWESTGQYGLIALGGGRFYLAENGTAKAVVKHTGRAVQYVWTGRTPTPFSRVTASKAVEPSLG
ncbi:hypothetical protein [Streptomyces sp. NPDC088725]|uniref:hypothetical protein n=1 Tax=Streptomyces sp. NPDC088725 TaxID=3365873 RepID=UPI0038113C00